MKHIVLGTTLVALLFAGCGDDDDDGDGTNGGTGNEAGTPAGGDGNTAAGSGATPLGGSDTGSGGTDSGSGGGGTNVECDPNGAGVCQNATDCPEVESGAARMASQTCGISCLESTEQTCARDCIVDETEITPECATCYAAAVGCAAANCLAPCGMDPASAACAQCQVAEGCRSDFSDCSGLPE